VKQVANVRRHLNGITHTGRAGGRYVTVPDGCLCAVPARPETPEDLSPSPGESQDAAACPPTAPRRGPLPSPSKGHE
jgi:hypothetical protein